MSAPTATGAHQRGVLHTLGMRVAGHSAIYVLGAILGSFYAIAQIAVLTRVLPVEGYGQLAVLVFYSGLVTTLCNLGFVTGTMLTFPFATGLGGGGSGDLDDGDDDEIDEIVDERQAVRRPAVPPMKLLGTGMTIALGLVVGTTLIAALLRHPLSHALGEPGEAVGVIWATMAGALGSVWRMVTSVPRYERRPHRYVALQGCYWLLAITLAATFAKAGYGVTGAMAGIAIGHFTACMVGLVMAWHKFRPAFVPAAVGHLGRRGLPYAAITVPGFLTRHADIYVLAMYVPHRELALYSVATRFTRIPALAATGAVFAFGPLARGPMRTALDRDNAGDVARGRIVNYYAMLATWNVVALAIWAPVVVGIVPRGYAHAALMIQIFAIVAAIHGGQGILYRMSRIPGKIKKLRWIVWSSGVMMVGSALVLTPHFGVWGVMVSMAISPCVFVPYLAFAGQRGPNPLPLGGRRLAGSILVGVLCWALSRLADPLPHRTEEWVDLAITASFPLLLVLTGVVPRAEAARLLGLVRGLWAPRSERGRLQGALAVMDGADVEFLSALAIRAEKPRDVAARMGSTDEEVRRRFVQLLRSLGPGGEPQPNDDQFADVLLMRGPRSERDRQANMLAGRRIIDGVELDRLMTLLDHLRRVPSAIWRQEPPGRFSRRVRLGRLPGPG